MVQSYGSDRGCVQVFEGMCIDCIYYVGEIGNSTYDPMGVDHPPYTDTFHVTHGQYKCKSASMPIISSNSNR